MVEPGGKGYCPCEYIPRVREAACLKDSLPADPLQPTFALEISCRCNGLLLAALPGTPWSLSVRAVDRRFSMPSDRDSSGPGLCPFFCLLSGIGGEVEGPLFDISLPGSQAQTT